MLTYASAATLLAAVEGCTFAGLDTVTVPTLAGGKKNPFQGKVTKHCLGSRVLLFTNKNVSGYLNKVKRHLEQEGLNPETFQMGPLPWGERIPNSPFIHHKGEHYLQCCFLKAPVSTEYVASELIRNDFDLIAYKPGDLIAKQNIPGLSEKTGSEHQGLERDKQVIIRTYKISSIVALRAMKSELV